MYKKNSLKPWVLLVAVFLYQSSFGGVAKNVVFMIGDGMGMAHITGARIYNGGSKSKLAMESFPVSGFSKTYCSDHYVTDSAAAATALASGVKTYKGAIGVGPDKKSKLETLVDLAKRQGKSVGFVTTTEVFAATPAGFFAHTLSRENKSELVSQVPTSGVDLFLGGGAGHFSESTLLAMEKKGWSILRNRQELLKLKPTVRSKVLGIFAKKQMHYEFERERDHLNEPTLQEMAEFAVSRLSKNKKGYFLMIEGGRIDVASHMNLAEAAFKEVIAFDRAIGSVLKKTSSKNTLVIVTADHETGGLAINGYNSTETTKGKTLLEGKSIKDGSSLISWSSGPGGDGEGTDPKYWPKEPIPSDLKHPSNFKTVEASHTAVDVVILARGPHQERFQGFMENTEIPMKVAKAMGTQFQSPVNARFRKEQDQK